MEILEKQVIHRATAMVKGAEKVFLAMHRLIISHGDRTTNYYCVSRGDQLPSPEEKKPDAVVVIGFVATPDEPKRIVLLSEFRPPIGGREISFPAGLIDAKDHQALMTGVVIGHARAMQFAAMAAAEREFFEETGLTLQPEEVSPPNLYSSAGMTNESSCYVFGHAFGRPNTDNVEADEDIQVLLLTHAELGKLLQSLDPASSSFDPTLNVSKTAWPLLWAYHRSGF